MSRHDVANSSSEITVEGKESSYTVDRRVEDEVFEGASSIESASRGSDRRSSPKSRITSKAAYTEIRHSSLPVESRGHIPGSQKLDAITKKSGSSSANGERGSYSKQQGTNSQVRSSVTSMVEDEGEEFADESEVTDSRMGKLRRKLS